MSKLKITPKKISGAVSVPPSKSMAHRAIICASLALGKSRIDHIEYSQDILATISAMQALGTKIDCFDDYIEVDGSTTYTTNNAVIDCKESGSTLRFMVPVALVKENKVNFIGEGNLGKRPLTTFYEIFDRQNVNYLYKEGELDLHVNGRLNADEFVIPGNISSQFISGLLFALPLLEKDSKIIISSTLESKGYIDLTLQMLETYGIKIINNNYEEFIIKGNQKYLSHDYYVEADYSQAAFYLVAGAIGNDVVLKGLNINSLQGDKEAIEILERMGAKLIEVDGGLKMYAESLTATVMDGSQCPDVIPVLSLAAAFANGTTTIINAERLRIKECDRLKAVYTELTKLGAKITETSDGLIIEGKTPLTGASVSSWADHRIAMTLAIAATISDGDLLLDNKECVKKSYPSFWEDYTMLGGIIDEC